MWDLSSSQDSEWSERNKIFSFPDDWHIKADVSVVGMRLSLVRPFARSPCEPFAFSVTCLDVS